MNESPVNPQPPSEHRSPSAAPAPSLAYEPPRDRIVTEPPPHVDTKVFAFILGFILAAGAIFVVNVRYVVSVFTFFGPPMPHPAAAKVCFRTAMVLLVPLACILVMPGWKTGRRWAVFGAFIGAEVSLLWAGYCYSWP